MYRKYATNNNSSICWVFVVFFQESSGKQVPGINHLALKICLEPTLEMKQKLFPRNKLRNTQFTLWIKRLNGINSYRILA